MADETGVERLRMRSLDIFVAGIHRNDHKIRHDLILLFSFYTRGLIKQLTVDAVN